MATFKVTFMMPDVAGTSLHMKN